VEAHLLTFGRVQGWVFSAWGEASKEEHQLVQRLAKARLELLAQPTLKRLSWLPWSLGSGASSASWLCSNSPDPAGPTAAVVRRRQEGQAAEGLGRAGVGRRGRR
jgi:hypothetical protein